VFQLAQGSWEAPSTQSLARRGKTILEPGEQQGGAIVILHSGGMDVDREQQADCVDQDVARAAVDPLPGVIAPDPHCSVVFTDGLSRIAPLGCGSRPARLRTRPRSAVLIRS